MRAEKTRVRKAGSAQYQADIEKLKMQNSMHESVVSQVKSLLAPLDEALEKLKAEHETAELRKLLAETLSKASMIDGLQSNLEKVAKQVSVELDEVQNDEQLGVRLAQALGAAANPVNDPQPAISDIILQNQEKEEAAKAKKQAKETDAGWTQESIKRWH